MTGEEGEEAGVRLRGMRLETTVHGTKMQSTTETLKKKKKKHEEYPPKQWYSKPKELKMV